MAWFNSPKLWNRRLRRRPRIQRSMISTPTSTLALSRGLRGLAGPGTVMRSHLRIGPVDLRLVQTRLDDRGPGVVRPHKRGHTADGLEGARVRTDPVGERLRPRRLRIREVRRPQDGNKNLRLLDLPGQPVNHHRDSVAGVIDK